MLLRKFSQWISRLFSGVGTTVQFSLAFVFLIGSPVLAIYVARMPLVVELAIVLCAVGAALGGLLLCGVMVKLAGNSEGTWSNREKMIRENERLKDTASRGQDENARLALEKEKLQSEKERLERMSIHVDSVAPIMKLGLLNVKMQTYDFQKEPVGQPAEYEEGLYGFRKKITEESEYVGLQHVTLEANLGIDLKQVRVEENDNILYVSGVRGESHGINNRQTKWLLREIREKRLVDGKEVEYKINANDPRITERVIEQGGSMESRLNQGLAFDHGQTIQNIAKEYIRLLLAPTGKEMRFLPPDETADNVPLLEQFIGQYNERINDKKRKIGDEISKREGVLMQQTGSGGRS